MSFLLYRLKQSDKHIVRNDIIDHGGCIYRPDIIMFEKCFSPVYHYTPIDFINCDYYTNNNMINSIQYDTSLCKLYNSKNDIENKLIKMKTKIKHITSYEDECELVLNGNVKITNYYKKNKNYKTDYNELINKISLTEYKNAFFHLLLQYNK